MTLGPDDPRHGTANGYVCHGCRCRPCTTANSDRVRAFRRRTGRSVPRAEYLASLSRTHGLRSTYKNGCKCERCRAASTAHGRDYRARKAAALP